MTGHRKRQGAALEFDPIAAALRDLAEFGWVDVPGRRLAEIIAGEAGRIGVRALVVPLSGHWYRVETRPRPRVERAWVVVRTVTARRPLAQPERAAGAGEPCGREPAEHIVVVDTGAVVRVFAFPADRGAAARAFARAVEALAGGDPADLERLAVLHGGRWR